MQVESLESRQMLSTVAWSVGPALPAPRTDAVAVVTPDQAIRLVGGDSAAATNAPVLSPGATSWSLGANTDTQRNDLGAVSSGGSVFLFGGTGNDEGSDEALDYDYLFGDSQDVSKMNTLRYDLGYATDALGRAYALGGIGVFADGEVWADAERYNPASDTWTSIASLPSALHGMSAVGDGNGHIFVFGGSTTLDDSGIQRTAYSYDVASDAWSTVAPMLVGTRDSATAVDNTGLIYVTGGMATTGATDAVQVYDPTTNTWAGETPLPEPVYSHAAALSSGRHIIVAGGFDVTGTATDAVYQTQDLTESDLAPVILTSPVTHGALDQFYSYDVDATGNPDPTYALVASPAGMEIDSASGLLSWQPIDGQVAVHSVVVQVSNRAGAVEQAFDLTVVADTIAPTTPTNFTFDSATQTSVTFSWTASSDAAGVDHYDIATAVYTGPRFGKRWVYTVVDTLPAASTTAILSGLSPLESHRYTVRAVDATGNISPWSTRVTGTALAPPSLAFEADGQTTGTITGPAKHPREIQLRSTANPTAEFFLLSGPPTMIVNQTTGLVQWTPTVADIGLYTVTFRAMNSIGSTDLDMTIEVFSDAPQLSVAYNPATGGGRSALAGTLYTAQVNDASQSTSTYELIRSPATMTIEAATGAIAWTPVGTDGGTHSVTVRATNAGGVADLTFNVETLFTGAVTGATVTGETLLNPTLRWVAPTGEGSDLVDSYTILGSATWGVGRNKQTHRVNFTVPASETSLLMTGMVPGRAYTIYVLPVNAAGSTGLRDAGIPVYSLPALPQVRWSVNGFIGGLSVPGPVVARQPVEVVLTDQRADPSTMTLVDGPVGLTFDSETNTASWTPTVDQVTSGFTTSIATFQTTNSVGSADVAVPMRVFFSGTVLAASAQRNGYIATASWDPPTDNATPIAAYRITRHWTFAGSHKASATWTVPGDVTSIAFTLGPTGAVSHKGITIAPVDAFGNLGVSTQRIAFGSFQNDLPPIATDDTFEATEDALLSVDSLEGVLENDFDTDNTPFASPLTAQLVSGPTNGTVSVNSDGSFVYTPSSDFHGSSSFVYRLYDGKFYSNNATVTIHVAPVNDAPVALDDYYFTNRDTPLAVNVAAGVLANDSDADGEVLRVAVVDKPANGSIRLSTEGSFNYSPNPGFGGIDTFTYVTSDTLLGSRVATVSIEVQLPPTKFFVVDSAVESTFEYAADGTLVDNYNLHSANKGSQGAATTSDGTTLYDVNGNKLVYVYDGDGGYLGRWRALGPNRVDGIATDDTDIWILDRKFDTVFHYAGAASLRSGEMAPTDSFNLHSNNKNGKGITTDGTNIWVVNNARVKDKVYKYDIDGNYLSRWNIDPLNSMPTGITIDPTGDSDAVWIVDNFSVRVYQYNGGTTRTGGSVTADDQFDLAAMNTNPQGIADASPVTSHPISAVTASSPQAIEEVVFVAALESLQWEDLHATREFGRAKFESLVNSGSLRHSLPTDTTTSLRPEKTVDDTAARAKHAWKDHLDEAMSHWSDHEEFDELTTGLAQEADSIRFSPPRRREYSNATYSETN